LAGATLARYPCPPALVCPPARRGPGGPGRTGKRDRAADLIAIVFGIVVPIAVMVALVHMN